MMTKRHRPANRPIGLWRGAVGPNWFADTSNGLAMVRAGESSAEPTLVIASSWPLGSS